MTARCATCGHLRSSHEHYRLGTECSQCYCHKFIHPLHGTWRDIVDWMAARFRRG